MYICIYTLQESAVHCLQIRGTQIEIIKTWQIEQPVTAVMHSPDSEMLVVTSNQVSSLNIVIFSQNILRGYCIHFSGANLYIEAKPVR